MIRVLIVDDDPLLRGAIRAVLLARKHIVDGAEDGEQALARIADSSPDIALLDLELTRLHASRCCAACVAATGHP